MSNQQKAAPRPLTPSSPSTPSTSSPQPDRRSPGLLPADGPDPRLEVAEEVSLDLQSDATRRVGAPPSDTPVGKPAEALAQSLRPGDAPNDGRLRAGERESEQLNEAIDRSVPPSG